MLRYTQLKPAAGLNSGPVTRPVIYNTVVGRAVLDMEVLQTNHRFLIRSGYGKGRR